MKNWIQFNESKDHKPYKVVICWEHGDADVKTQTELFFNTEDESSEFLNFIYDYRKFIPNSGYENCGCFSDSHSESKSSWLKKIDSKYSNKFSQFIPFDSYYKSNDYHPCIRGIHIEIQGIIHNIIWEKALKSNIINLPKIGDKIDLSTGHINGSSVGPENFGGKPSDYLDYDDFWSVLESSNDYYDINVLVTDCKIDIYEPYNHEKYNRNNKLIGSITVHSDYTSFQYYQLCRISDKYIITSSYGFDPQYGDKFHRPKYGLSDYFLV